MAENKALPARRIHAASAAAAVANWDGYGAKAVSPETVDMAKRFAASIPSHMGAPEVSADPDGELSFDWELGDNRRLSVSISAAGRLAFVSVNGGQPRERGALWFRGNFPHELTAIASLPRGSHEDQRGA